MKPSRISTILTVVFLAVLIADARPQQGLSNARSVGMGGAYTALARGVEAPMWNPANLGLSPRNKFSVNLASLGIGLNNNSFSKSQYKQYNGGYWQEADRLAILQSLPEGGLRLNAEGEFQLLSLGVGSAAVSVSGMAWSDLRFDRDYFDLLLNGNELGRTYDFSDTEGRAALISGVGVSVGFPLALTPAPETSVGLTIRYVTGWLYGEVLNSDGTLVTNLNGAQGEAKIVTRSATGGSGIAVDLGTAADLGKTWYVSLAWQNAVGGVRWTKETKEYEYRVTADSVTAEDASGVDADSLFHTVDSERPIESFRSGLPSKLRLGVARTGKGITLAFEIAQRIRQNEVFRNGPRVAFGLELKPIGLLPLRAGLATGGRAGTTSSLGVGLHLWTLRFDAAVVNYGGISPGSGKGLGLAAGVKFQ